MMWYWALVAEQGQKKPHAVVVHAEHVEPKWTPVDASMEAVLRALFRREAVFYNMPEDGGYKRLKRSWGDADYLEIAMQKVNLPLYISQHGKWDSNFTTAEDVLAYLETRFLKDAAAA